jgi:hypothetical protein
MSPLKRPSWVQGIAEVTPSPAVLIRPFANLTGDPKWKFLAQEPPSGVSHEAVLRFYNLHPTGGHEAFLQVLASLQAAVRADPDRGFLWALLARIYALNQVFEVTAEPTPLEDALRYAQKGICLAPDSTHAHAVLALVHLVNNDLEAR